ncbi:MAG: CoA pyrophosphatase [Pirellulales bacterium]
MSASSQLPSKETSDEELPRRLSQALRGELPGRAAQALMEPGAAYGRHFGVPTFDVRPAAVLVLLYRRGGAWRVVLTERHADLATHAGQISLPGGLIEAGETVRQAAERELWEETGVAAEGLTPLGALSPINLFSTHFFVQPCVAYCGQCARVSPESARGGLATGADAR